MNAAAYPGKLAFRIVKAGVTEPVVCCSQVLCNTEHLGTKIRLGLPNSFLHCANFVRSLLEPRMVF